MFLLVIELPVLVESPSTLPEGESIWINNTTLTFYDTWVKSKPDHWFIKEWTFGLSQNCYENVLETREELGKTTVDFTENFRRFTRRQHKHHGFFPFFFVFRFFPLDQRNDPLGHTSPDVARNLQSASIFVSAASRGSLMELTTSLHIKHMKGRNEP